MRICALQLYTIALNDSRIARYLALASQSGARVAVLGEYVLNSFFTDIREMPAAVLREQSRLNELNLALLAKKHKMTIIAPLVRFVRGKPVKAMARFSPKGAEFAAQNALIDYAHWDEAGFFANERRGTGDAGGKSGVAGVGANVASASVVVDANVASAGAANSNLTLSGAISQATCATSAAKNEKSAKAAKSTRATKKSENPATNAPNSNLGVAAGASTNSNLTKNAGKPCAKNAEFGGENLENLAQNPAHPAQNPENPATTAQPNSNLAATAPALTPAPTTNSAPVPTNFATQKPAEFLRFEIDGVRFVCAFGFELHFDALWREISRTRPHCVLVPSACTLGSHERWSHLLVARAFCAGSYILRANRLGKVRFGEVESDFYGNSLLVDPNGAVVESLEQNEGILICDIDAGEVEAARARWGFWGNY